MKILDNFLTELEYYEVDKIRFEPRYNYGENDLYPLDNPIPNGMSLTINPDENIFKIFSQKTKETFSEVKDLYLQRIYVNCFAPLEWSYYHTDNDNFGFTCLYYLNDTWDINDGGETHFYDNAEIIAIPPIPNRIVCFDSTVLHKATPFKSKHRFTIAMKYT
jgi:hypothetical protein